MSDQTTLEFHVEPDAEMPIEQLMTMFHPNNSQARLPHELEAIKLAILADGFIAEMVIVNPWNDKIVSGHGRVQACWDLGYRGTLPVVLKSYSSETEHRLAMLRWNRARGHQDLELEQRELSDLMQLHSKEELARILAYTDAELTALLPEFQTPPSLDELAGQYGLSQDRDFWPWLKVAVPPEAMALYQSFTEDLPGHDDAWKVDQILRAVDEGALRGMK